MLYEAAYPALYVGAKFHQIARRFKARIGKAPADMARVTYNPDSYYRVTCWRLRRIDIELMMLVAPTRAARIAIERFERTKPLPARTSFETKTDDAETKDITYGGRNIHMRFYGPEAGPKILAVHGWNGRASMLRKMVYALAIEGYRVIVPDLPGHGQSDGNRFSFYDLGQALADLFEDTSFEAVIGHSAGGLITGIAIGRGLKSACYIPIAAPSSLDNLLKSYVEIAQMPERSLPFISRYYTRRYGIPPNDVGPTLIASLDVRTLVIHETNDWQVGVENAEQLAEAARDGELFLTTGFTHLSVLNAPEVHTQITGFITRGQDA